MQRCLKVVEKMDPCDFKTDLTNFIELATVQELSDDRIPHIKHIKKAMSEGVGAYTSRFSRALRLFPTGKDIMDLVDKEELALKQDDGVLLVLEELRKPAAWPATTVLAASSTSSPVGFSEADLKLYEHAHKNLVNIVNNMSARFAVKVSIELKVFQAKLDAAAECIDKAVRANFDKVMTSTLNAHKTLMQNKVDDAGMEKMVLELKVVLSVAVPSIPTLGLDRFGRGRADGSLSIYLGHCAGVVQALQSGIGPALLQNPDIEDKGLVTLMELFLKETPMPSTSSPMLINSFEAYRNAVVTILQKSTSTFFECKFGKWAPLAAKLDKALASREKLLEFLGKEGSGAECPTDAAREAALNFVKKFFKFCDPSDVKLKVDGQAVTVSSSALLWSSYLGAFATTVSGLASALAPAAPAPEGPMIEGEEEGKTNYLASLEARLVACDRSAALLTSMGEFVEAWSSAGPSAKMEQLDMIQDVCGHHVKEQKATLLDWGC
jgi:hypothetical protein